ncbi:4Fe-4S dicluster domain-containing protein [Desulfoluna spongiiphila]|uniref:Protein NrfC n=1 Tax=Desulfoluna spongiiphila TaxID=419481 RepID=A0A1G5GCR2_9BACT|nr:4Fe-4S dicluster domain-containing protein [Desulfoluna spongiiphila]SCY49322.1 protein NrfC [Desulfoluna spongiiphila]
MEDRRTFIKHGLLLCAGAGGLLAVRAESAPKKRPDGQWTMVVDSALCTGCNACMVACKLQHNTEKGKFNTHVVEEEKGTFPHASLGFSPTLCHHCDDAPCVKACPTGASAKDPCGAVTMDWSLCNGCGSCLPTCPHNARFADSRFGNRADKCDLCLDRISQGLQPACVENCASGARTFGRSDGPNEAFAGQVEKIRRHNENDSNGAVLFCKGNTGGTQA